MNKKAFVGFETGVFMRESLFELAAVPAYFRNSEQSRRTCSLGVESEDLIVSAWVITLN